MSWVVWQRSERRHDEINDRHDDIDDRHDDINDRHDDINDRHDDSRVVTTIREHVDLVVSCRQYDMTPNNFN